MISVFQVPLLSGNPYSNYLRFHELALYFQGGPRRNMDNDVFSCAQTPHPQPLSKVERGDFHPLEKRAGVVTVETGIPPELLKNARRLRKNQTDAERLLWQALRNRKLNNWKFRRQHPISEAFILDFYCAETKVAIELDGTHHQLNDQMKYDKNRTEYLEELGIRLIRILNEEVHKSKKNVLQKITAFTNSPAPSILGSGQK